MDSFLSYIKRFDRQSILWRMYVMASSQKTTHSRQDLLRKLLHGASPRNPTYVLGRILLRFKAQGSTELTVQKGEEVFILFEISDWAYVTVFSDTKRKGYIPLDYCDVVQDFYDWPKENKLHTIRQDNSKCVTVNHNYSQDETKKYSVASPSSHKEKRSSYVTTNEKLTDNPAGCRCCIHHHQHGSSDSGMENVLKYLSQSEIHDSADIQDENESGLGDSESVQSAGDLQHKLCIDLNDIATQTSQSLEDLCAAAQEPTDGGDSSNGNPTHLNADMSLSLSCYKHAPARMNLTKQSSSTYNHDTPTPHRQMSHSTDSAYGESIYSSPQSYTKIHHVEVNQSNSPTVTDGMITSYEDVSSWSSDSDETDATVQSDHQRYGWRSRLPIPILESSNNQANRVELTRLSERIRDKLKPAVEEFKMNRISTTSVDEGVSRRPSRLVSGSACVRSPSIGRKERKATLQSIKEQYLKLEEARLLHDALKHLNKAIANTD